MCGHCEPYGHHWYHGCYPEYYYREPPFRQRFPSQEEKITRLEEYIDELRAETRSLEERLVEMRGPK
jgi:hypothetical protein